MLLDGQLTKREQLRIDRARLAEARERGDYPAELRDEAWENVGRTLRESRSHRTRLMASRMVLERTDPPPREPVAILAPVVMTWQEPPSPDTSRSRTRHDPCNGNFTSASPANGSVSWLPTDDSARP